MMPRIPALTLACAWLLAPSAGAQQAYPTPAAAADALVAALEARDKDPQRLATVLGADWELYVPRDSVEREDVDAFVEKYRQQHRFQATDDRHSVLSVGTDAWTLPVPVVKQAAGWAFDLKAAEPELRARRIGRNERDALQAVLAYYDAQKDYASKDRDNDGLLEYATRFRSTEGQRDGLYWEADESGESPLGPLFGDDTPDGEWHGYHYKILLEQGPSAPRGAYKYLLGAHMTRGFALVAWPARYGDSGVMSFTISHAGDIFEKDMGPETDRIARAMTLFDPDSSWTEVDPDEEADAEAKP
jgi:hypothetical protein